MPIGRFAQFRSRQQKQKQKQSSTSSNSSNSGNSGNSSGGVGKAAVAEKGVDVTTLAVVQMMLLFREHGDWGVAISKCPAMHCAPMRKYVRWLEPYTHLNDATRPAKLV